MKMMPTFLHIGAAISKILNKQTSANILCVTCRGDISHQFVVFR